MRIFGLLLFLCIFSGSLIAQKLDKQPWLGLVEGDLVQFTFENDFIKFENLPDPSGEEGSSGAFEAALEIVEKVVSKDRVTFYIKAPQGENLGMIQVFDIQKHRLKLFVQERIASIEEAKSNWAEVPLGIQLYSPKEVSQIKTYPSAHDMSLKQAQDYLDALEAKIKVAVIGAEDLPIDLYEQEKYYFNLIFDTLVELEYNIFDRPDMSMGIQKYRNNADIKAKMKQIESMIEIRKNKSKTKSEPSDH